MIRRLRRRTRRIRGSDLFQKERGKVASEDPRRFGFMLCQVPKPGLHT